MIEKMLEKFEELRMRYFLTIANSGDEKLDFTYWYIGKAIDHCKEIVQEVAKEYEPCYKDCAECEAYDKVKHNCPKFCKVIKETVKEYGKDTNVGKWIPTAEMLFPRYGQKVLASVRTDIATHEVIITTYERQEYWHNGIITAWKPLDAPYQKGE